VADLLWVEGDVGLDQGFVLEQGNGAISLQPGTSVVWATQLPDGTWHEQSATVVVPTWAFCRIVFEPEHMDSPGYRRVRVRVSWPDRGLDQWFPSDGYLEALILPHTADRSPPPEEEEE
jgi:hypothetical protein